jgi:hypothetical protein
MHTGGVSGWVGLGGGRTLVQLQLPFAAAMAGYCGPAECRVRSVLSAAKQPTCAAEGAGCVGEAGAVEVGQNDGVHLTPAAQRAQHGAACTRTQQQHSSACTSRTQPLMWPLLLLTGSTELLCNGGAASPSPSPSLNPSPSPPGGDQVSNRQHRKGGHHRQIGLGQGDPKGGAHYVGQVGNALPCSTEGSTQGSTHGGMGDCGGGKQGQRRQLPALTVHGSAC